MGHHYKHCKDQRGCFYACVFLLEDSKVNVFVTDFKSNKNASFYSHSNIYKAIVMIYRHSALLSTLKRYTVHLAFPDLPDFQGIFCAIAS